MTRSQLVDAGRAALGAGRAAEAGELAERLLAETPSDIDALELAALAAAARGDAVGAEQRFRTIIGLDPSASWARDDLARLLMEQGRAAEAEAVVRGALAADPGAQAAHALLGQLLSEREILPEGAWHLRRAVSLGRPDAVLHANLARNLLRQGRLGEAGEQARAAAALAPLTLAPHVLLAEIAERSGDLDGAEAALARAEPIARREDRDLLLLRAVILSRGNRWADALASLDRVNEPSGGARLLRGRLRDRAGRYDEAWADFSAGKAALAEAAGRRYDRSAVERRFTALAAFPARLPVAPGRTDVPQPLFVLGFPRSGTTLTEQILSAHPAIRAGGELPFVGELAALAQRLTGAFPAGLAALHAADFHHLPALLRDALLARAAVHGLDQPGARFFTDKMPLNEALLPLIRLAFPHAPAILLRRDPRDVIVSVMMHDMTHGGGCGDRPEDAAHHLVAVHRLLAVYRDRLGLAPHVVRYERLVTDPATQLPRLMDAVGLPFDPAQSRFHTTERHAPTPSYAQVQEPLHDRSIGRWHHYQSQLAPIMAMLDPLISDWESDG